MNRTKIVFCRNGYEYTDVYATLLTPHVAKLLQSNIKSCILDGEMMGWNKNLKCFKYKGKRRIIFLSAIGLNCVLFISVSNSGSYDCRKCYTSSLSFTLECT
jgi:hypothetical protein